MSFRRRVYKVEKHLPTSQIEEELDEISCWLIENNKEFQDGIRQMFRLQCRAESSLENIDDWEESLKQEVLTVMQRLEEIKQYYTKAGIPS